MSSDKRTVATDALETLGTIIDETAARDAIHLAVEPMVAAHTLRPGEDVGLYGDGTAGASEDPVGIVDPFLKRAVMAGQRFWLVVYPRKITSLRHVWTHPAFDDKAAAVPQVDIAKRKSIAWIRDYADKFGVKYDELIEHAEYYARDENHYWSEGGRFEGEWIEPEFWDHFTAVTGIVPKDRGSFFSCSC